MSFVPAFDGPKKPLYFHILIPKAEIPWRWTESRGLHICNFLNS